MRIGYFGGSFNPPHFGHILAASYALSRFSLDQLWWGPVHVHAFAKSLIDFEHRCNMLELCLNDLGPKQKLSKIEVELDAGGRSLLILRALKEKHPEHDFCLMIGSDTIDHLPKWYKIDALKKEFEMCIIPRKSYLADKDDFVIPNVSSTSARRAIENIQEEPGAKGKLEQWIHPNVIKYIQTHSLYSNKERKK